MKRARMTARQWWAFGAGLFVGVIINSVWDPLITAGPIGRATSAGLTVGACLVVAHWLEERTRRSGQK
jgi:hypothetical protein